MTTLFYLFLAVAALLILFLLFALVSQLRSTRHFEQLDKEAARAKNRSTETKPEVKSENKEREATPVDTTPEVLVPAPTVVPEDFSVEEEPASVMEEVTPEPEVTSVEDATAEPVVDLKTYPPFDHARAVEQLGLSEEEAVMFIGELVQQIRDELPNLRSAFEAHDMKNLEEITHLLKGSATNLGDGGIAEMLTEFNDYCKAADDPDILTMHMRQLEVELEKLGEKYG